MTMQYVRSCAATCGHPSPPCRCSLSLATVLVEAQALANHPDGAAVPLPAACRSWCAAKGIEIQAWGALAGGADPAPPLLGSPARPTAPWTRGRRRADRDRTGRRRRGEPRTVRRCSRRRGPPPTRPGAHERRSPDSRSACRSRRRPWWSAGRDCPTASARGGRLIPADRGLCAGSPAGAAMTHEDWYARGPRHVDARCL
ncbi:hypothetical protein QJS66_11095 [Kocuria rhizophila]|nr:hypothetical protein QJS66_11095 [Kocuria rhizophila]